MFPQIVHDYLDTALLSKVSETILYLNDSSKFSNYSVHLLIGTEAAGVAWWSSHKGRRGEAAKKFHL
jgi:hypothetical protein